ncbi:hypothetical protein IQ07DRAFT_102619 [Pyrenochaeta sp. DS3sAY3a]|nr:hypothetical protein IQ07DRAFT_102619 [Pyrenochaeta sp. DS3sAY3a]
MQTPRASLLSLPAELRLHIAAYAFNQQPNAGLMKSNIPLSRGFPSRMQRRSGLCIDPGYSASSNLALLLVCRQFYHDFKDIAFQFTRFIITANPAGTIAQQPDQLLKRLRTLLIQCDSASITTWQTFPFNNSTIKLDELTLVLECIPHDLEMPRLLRRLKNIRVLKFIVSSQKYISSRLEVNRMCGGILREDHYQRYDAPNAPNIEATWWEWSSSGKDNIFTLIAQPPRPIMEEQEYMRYVKPKVDRIMQNMVRWSALPAHSIGESSDEG